MAEKKLNPKPFFFLGVILVVVLGGYFILGGGGEQRNYYEFASCLADEGATMYGFDACPHCNKQKNIIGRQAFRQELDNRSIDRGFYIRCQPPSERQMTLEEAGIAVDEVSSVNNSLDASTTQAEACQVNVGAGTPTWVIDEQKYVGEQTLADLAEATGCPLPENYEETETGGGFTAQNQTG